MILTFLEFTNNMCFVCEKCSIEKLKHNKSSFCYTAYKKNTYLFMTCSYQLLRKTQGWPVSISKENKLIRNIFCKSGICGDLHGLECKNLNMCASKLTNQMRVYTSVGFDCDSLPFTIKLDIPTIIFGGSKKWVNMIKNME